MSLTKVEARLGVLLPAYPSLYCRHRGMSLTAVAVWDTVNTHLYSRLADIVAPLFLTDLVSAQGIRRSY